MKIFPACFSTPFITARHALLPTQMFSGFGVLGKGDDLRKGIGTINGLQGGAP